jgi:AcrR family transcriptional regulator
MGRVAGLTPEETRQRVLDAAAGVFAEYGFEGARVAQIARAAGLSVGAIYNHYGSKAELLAAVVEQHSAHELSGLLASGGSRSP